jgi:uncharacterized membrane protein (UPF0127 family)
VSARRAFAQSIACAALLLFSFACSNGAARPQAPEAPEPKVDEARAKQPAVVLSPAGASEVRVSVELARTPAERQKGLMYRERLAADAGMLFIFERPDHLSFWMHNTYIPLDMIFISDTLRVVGVVENAEPRTDAPRAVEGLSQYVLEVNAGFSRPRGITAGTAVAFEGIDVAGPRTQ